MQSSKTLLTILTMLWLTTACSAPVASNDNLNFQVETAVAQMLLAADEDTPTPLETTAPDIPQVPLTICLGAQPGLAFSPAITSPAVLQLLQPAGVIQQDYNWQAGSLANIPSIANDTAQIQTVSVQAGDTVLNSDGQPVALQGGIYVRPAGCRDGNCAIPFDPRTNLQMEQLQVTFELRQDFYWQYDAQLTAENSVAAFSLDQTGQLDTISEQAARTAAYTQTDTYTATWLGIPGYLPQNYATHYWPPIPHDSQPQDARDSLSYGPYRLAEIVEPDHIELILRPEYLAQYHYTKLIFKRIDPSQWHLNLLQSADCDVLDQTISASIWPGSPVEGITQHAIDGEAWEGLHFGITPRSYDDIYSQPGGDRPNYFGDNRVRQALAMCINREAVATAVGASDVLETYISSEHPASSSAPLAYSYNPQAGAALLEEAGWSVGTEDIRIAKNIFGIQDGTPFTLNYFTLDDERSLATAKMIVKDLEACGIEVALSAGDAATLFATGETGLLFGRNFDLAQFAWPFSPDLAPTCELYFSNAIPGADFSRFSYGWGGWNLTGWADESFDEACRQARAALPGEETYTAAHQQTQAIFTEQLPTLPLFIHPIFYLANADICGQTENVTPFTYNIAAWSPCQ